MTAKKERVRKDYDDATLQAKLAEFMRLEPLVKAVEAKYEFIMDRAAVPAPVVKEKKEKKVVKVDKVVKTEAK